MNRIYQGKVTAVEIPDLGYRLSRIGHSPQAQPLGIESSAAALFCG